MTDAKKEIELWQTELTAAIKSNAGKKTGNRFEFVTPFKKIPEFNSHMTWDAYGIDELIRALSKDLGVQVLIYIQPKIIPNSSFVDGHEFVVTIG